MRQPRRRHGSSASRIRPLYDFEWYSQTWGVVIVAVTATAIGAIAYALGIRSPDYPVVIVGDDGDDSA